MVTETHETETELPPNEMPPPPAPLLPVEPDESVPARRGPRGLTMALLLIGVGLALLLNNLGIITVDWSSVWRFWPLLLILVGLEVMLGHRSFLGSLSIVLLGVALVFGVIFFSTGIPSGDGITRNFSQELIGIDSLAIDLDLGAGNTTITSSAVGQPAVQASYTTGEDAGQLIEYTTRGNVGYLTTLSEPRWFGMTGFGDLDLIMNTAALPVDLTVDVGMGNATLDLSGIQLLSLDVNSGAGNVTIILPDQGRYTVTADAGAGNIDITLPEGFPASVEADSGLGNVSIDAADLAEVNDDLWQTSDFENAATGADIEVDAGVGNVSVSNSAP